MKNDDADQSNFMNLGKIMAYLGILMLRIVKREVYSQVFIRLLPERILLTKCFEGIIH